MKKISLKTITAKLASLTALLTLAIQGLMGANASAAAATLSLNPASASLTQGSSTVLSVQVSAGGATISAVQACVVYDSSKLELTNTDFSGLPLAWATPSDPASDCAAGQIQIARFDYQNLPTGTFTVARLTFKALGNSGSVSLTFGGASFVYDNVSSGAPPGIYTGSSGATIALSPVPAQQNNPNPGSSTPTGGTSGGSSSSGSSSKPAATNSTPTAAITDSGRTTNSETYQATSADVKIPLTNTGDKVATSTTSKKTTPTKTLAILGGATAVAVVAAVLMAKFVGVPGIAAAGSAVASHTAAGSAASTAASAGAGTPPPNAGQAAKPSISSVPDPSVPGPSEVIQPTHGPDEPPKV